MFRSDDDPSDAERCHLAVAECAAIAADLERLKALIADAGDRLAASFATIGDAAAVQGADPARQRRFSGAVGQAVVALQFQDLATQLVAHAQRRLAVLQETLKLRHAPADPLGANTRLQPVKQTGMGAGSIDLFL